MGGILIYYTIVNDNILFKQYICESNGEIALISFCEKDFGNLYQCVKQYNEQEKVFDWEMLQAVNFEFVGKDNYLYRMSYTSGEVKKVFKWPLQKLIKQYKDSSKIRSQILKEKEYIANNYQYDMLVKQKSLIPNYSKYKFIDRENLLSIPFRFKKSSKENMPLVIYFHGAGALGNDNIKQFLEYKGMSIRLSKRKCNVLIPQSTLDIGENIAIIRKYCKVVKKLVEKLTKIAKIDLDRIYLVGASYGGACVWYSLYDFPKFYAAAIPLMGYFPHCNLLGFDVKRFETENIWIGHAENDKVVLIQDDEKMFEILSSNGYSVKMSRYKKYGHNMSGIFLRKEKWKSWLFVQKRQS